MCDDEIFMNLYRIAFFSSLIQSEPTQKNKQWQQQRQQNDVEAIAFSRMEQIIS